MKKFHDVTMDFDQHRDIAFGRWSGAAFRGLAWRLTWRAPETVGQFQAATASEVSWSSLAGMADYQLVNRSRSVPSRVASPGLQEEVGPFLDQCICCFL